MRSSSAACWSAANPKVNGERFGRTNRDLIRFRRRAPANGRYEKSTGNLTDAQIVTLCVAQVLMGIPSDRRFLRAARRQLGHLFPQLPSQDAFHKRRARLAETIEWLIGVFAAQSPGSSDDLLLWSSPAFVARFGCDGRCVRRRVEAISACVGGDSGGRDRGCCRSGCRLCACAGVARRCCRR
jgi:hypothetical protein